MSATTSKPHNQKRCCLGERRLTYPYTRAHSGVCACLVSKAYKPAPSCALFITTDNQTTDSCRPVYRLRVNNETRRTPHTDVIQRSPDRKRSRVHAEQACPLSRTKKKITYPRLPPPVSGPEKRAGSFGPAAPACPATSPKCECPRSSGQSQVPKSSPAIHP